MGAGRENSPFFSEFARDLNRANKDEERAVTELLARNPMFYQTSMFRAFLHYGDEKIDNLGYDEFIDSSIMLKEVLKVFHAPYIKKEDVNIQTDPNG